MPQRFGNTADAPDEQPQRFGSAEDARIPDEIKPKSAPGFFDMAQRAGGRVAHNIGETVSGLASALTTNPATTFENMRQGTKGALDRMDKAQGLRKIAPALGAIPIVGPAAEQFAGDIQEQNYPEAFGDAASALTIAKAPKIIPKVAEVAANTGGKVLQMASKPAVLGTAGYVAGHTIGKELGIPWYLSGPAGAAGGRALGKYLNKPGEPIKPPMASTEVAAPVPSVEYPPLEGVPYDKLPPHLQRIVRDSMGTPQMQAPNPKVMPPAAEPRPPEYYGVQAKPTIGAPPEGVSVNPEAAGEILKRVEHPPFAESRPLPKAKRARELERAKELTKDAGDSGVSQAAVDRLKPNAPAFEAAWKLRQSMGGK